MTTPLYKKELIALSCVTALASFALIAKPAFADEVHREDNLAKTEIVAESAVAESKASTSTVLSEASTPSTSVVASEATSEVTSQVATAQSELQTSQAALASETASPSLASSETASSTAQESQVSTSETSGGYYSDTEGNWYYRDAKGQNLTGAQVVDYFHVYFDQDGKQIKGAFAPDGHYYAQGSGRLVSSAYVDVEGSWYYLDSQGNKLTGAQTVDGVQVYFDENGKQVKGSFAPDGNFYDPNSGALISGQYYLADGHFYDKTNNQVATSRYVEFDGHWYYVNDKGEKLTGSQTIDGVKVYFDETGAQVRGGFAYHDFNNYYYDKDTGSLVTNDFVEDQGNRYYVDKNGRKFRIGGVHEVKGQKVAFVYGDAHVALGEWLHPAGTNGFYDYNNKRFKGPGFITDRKGTLYYFNGSDQRPINLNIIDGNLYYLGNPSDKYANGKVFRDGLIHIANANPLLEGSSNIFYFDKETGAAIKGQYKEVDGSWYYFGPNWYALTGEQTIDSVPVYFDKDGKQVKGAFADNGRYYDKDSGALVTSKYIEVDGDWYYVNQDGYKLVGPQTVDYVHVCFDQDGKQIKDRLSISEDGETYHYYLPNSGARAENIDISIDGVTYHFDADGKGHLVHQEESKN